MPAQIPATMPPDDMEDEVLYSRAALKADPDAAPLVIHTEPWTGWVDDVRRLMRTSREATADADARRIVANSRLDAICTAIGDALYLAVGKDRESPRWQQFFHGPVHRFVNGRLADQTAAVRGWLDIQDPVLDPFRPELIKWTKAADDALVATNGTAGARGKAWIAREELAAALTRGRDALHAELSRTAREKNFDRKWPDCWRSPRSAEI